jgi:hypothetical protein
MPEDVTFASGDVTLAGTLRQPDGGRAHTGVVMVGGSGPSDRDNDGFFPPIRSALVAAGVAVVSYDKRGVGASGGEWLDATLDDFATDALAALALLRAQGVTSAGLFGHSEGGWVVLRAAARADASWVIANSCPGMTPGAQDRFGTTNWLRKEGATEGEIAEAAARYDAVGEAGRRGAGFAEVSALLADYDDPYELWVDLDERSWEFMRRKQDHDPLPDLRALRCPVLAVYGGADQLVPVRESIDLFSGVACEPDRDPAAIFDVAVFPGANHRVQTETGALAAGYLDRLVGWVGQI